MPQRPPSLLPQPPRAPVARTLARLSAGALAGGLLAGTLGAAGAAGAAETSPAALVAAAQAAAAHQSSVRYVATSSLGNESISIVADAAGSAGVETIRLRNASQLGLVTARYTGQAVYFRGNANGLGGYIGMPSTLAAKYAGKWIAFTPSEKNYAAIARSMTLGAAAAQISIDPPFTSSAGPRVGGVPTVVVHGTTSTLSSSGNKGTASLTIRSTGSPLPVSFVGRGTQSGKTETGRVVFSRWGEPVHVTAPSSSVNASTITTGGAGSSGSGSSTPSSTSNAS